MEKRIVLASGQREFQNLPDKIRHDGATSAALRFEPRRVGYGHIVGELESIEPILIAIHGSGAKATRLVLVHVRIDFLGSPKKLLPFLEKAPIMVQVMHVEFEAAAPDTRYLVLSHLITLFRNHLKCRFEAVGIVNSLQRRAEIASNGSLDIVRHDQAIRRTPGPKPDKRHFLDVCGLHTLPQDLFMQRVHGEIDWPVGKRYLLPIVQIGALQMPAHGDGERATAKIIGLANKRVIEKPFG